MGSGCRKGLEPTVDNNLPPETWITAAPADTITTKDQFGHPIAPNPSILPVRYHMYWAGADKDGAVVGYYWAVTETTATSLGDGIPIPELPGPKARDYHFTRRTDSVFVFDASPDAAERQHAFYVYAVDDKGRADATPAKLTFVAKDRFPPVPIFDQARATGPVYIATASGATSSIQSFDIHGIFRAGNPNPVDTVPSSAQIHFAWHALRPLPTSVCVGYRYRLDEPDFSSADSSVHSVTYNTHVNNDIIAPGVKKFTLQAMSQSGWHGDSTRFFQMNFEPDEWFSGPDTNSTYWSSYTDDTPQHKRYWYHDVTSATDPSLNWVSWAIGGGVPGTMLSPDSAKTLPANRPRMRTFFELHGNRISAHAEGDTVSLNSIVIFPSGGIDKDSPYAVKVGYDPTAPIGAVTTAGPANGSPIGFRRLVVTRKPDRTIQLPTESGLYPVFDVTSSYRQNLINGMAPLRATGMAYCYAIAQDGDGVVDRRIDRAGGVLTVVDGVDGDPYFSGTVTQEMRNARKLVMKFYVNHAPYFMTDSSAFTPRPNGTSSYRRGASVSFNLLANDIDPLDYEADYTSPGGPSSGKVLVYTVTLSGTDSTGAAKTWSICHDLEMTGNLPFTMPGDLAIGTATVNLTLRDYRPVDVNAGNMGRTTTLQIPIQITGPQPYGAAESSIPQSTQRPGSPQAVGRRQLP